MWECMYSYRGGLYNLSHILTCEEVESNISWRSLLRRPEQIPVRDPGPVVDIPHYSERRTFNILENQQEQRDLHDLGWWQLKQITTDKARKQHARAAFNNPVFTEPGINLGYHGYRRRFIPGAAPCKSGSSDVILGSCSLIQGCLVPLSGHKRKIQDRDDGWNVPANKMMLHDLGRVIKYKYTEILLEKAEITQNDVDMFVSSLNKYSRAQEETANFLAFYAERRFPSVDSKQAEEIFDIVTFFQKFKEIY